MNKQTVVDLVEVMMDGLAEIGKIEREFWIDVCKSIEESKRLMRTFDTIFPEIRNKLKIEHKLGLVSSDFISNLQTYRVTAKHPKLKRIKIHKGENVFAVSPTTFAVYTKLSDEFLEDVDAVNDYAFSMEKDLVRPIWRINQKRIAHGLQSWF